MAILAGAVLYLASLMLRFRSSASLAQGLNEQEAEGCRRLIKLQLKVHGSLVMRGGGRESQACTLMRWRVEEKYEANRAKNK